MTNMSNFIVFLSKIQILVSISEAFSSISAVGYTCLPCKITLVLKYISILFGLTAALDVVHWR